MSRSKILINAMRTPDGTLLKSLHRHDYVTYTDANGKVYMLDGGTDYVRCSVNGDESFETVYYDPHNHQSNRKALYWASFGIDGKGPRKVCPICDLGTGHIQAILNTQTHIPKHYRAIFETELEYRRCE